MGTKENELPSLIRTTEAIPDFVRCFYFEARITDCGKDGAIGIGLTTRHTDRELMPGWSEGTVGYHGDDGGIFQENAMLLGEAAETFTTHDVVSCRVKRVQVDESNFYNVIQFGKNGTIVGSPRYIKNSELYPTIGIHTPGGKVETNLGERPFAYTLKGNIMQQ